MSEATLARNEDRGGREIAPAAANAPALRTWPLSPRASEGEEQRPRRGSRFKLWSFLALVCLPTLAAAVYFGFYASSQYASETRFGVRTAEARGNDASAIFQGMASASQIGLESNVVVQYAQSREIVDALQKSIDLRAIFSRSGVDAVARLDPAVSIEELVEYWRKKIDPFFDLTTGSISVRVKAFTPEDSQKIAAEVVRLSEGLVNEMSRRARSDSVQLAQEEVVKAEERLRKTRAALLAFRDKEQILDPGKQADSSMTLITKLKEELAKYNAELQTARSYMQENSPAVRSLVTKVRSQQEQVRQAEARLTATRNTPNGDSLSRAMEGFDALDTERKLAEKYYDTTLENLQKAQASANRQAIYLQVFVNPAVPEKAMFPRRIESTGLTLLAGLGLWILALLTVSSIRDHA